MSIVTPTSDGGHVETFVDNSSGSAALHAQLYDAGGLRVGAELVVSYRVLGPYDVTALPGGGYALVYQSVSPGGSWGVIDVVGADGAVVRQMETGGGTDFHVTAGANGALLVSYVGIPQDHGLGPSQPLLQYYDPQGQAAARVELPGQIASITPEASGLIDVAWRDGGVTRDLAFGPGQSPHPPSATMATLFDDLGPQPAALANGATTQDATPVIRLSVSEPGFAFVELDKDTGGGVWYHNQGGGVPVTAADVARGYIEIPLQTQGDGHYYVWARTSDAAGAATDPVALNFTLEGGQAASQSNSPDLWASAILREDASAGPHASDIAAISAGLASGSETSDQALSDVIRLAAATSSVATLTYEFFTGAAPSAAGMDYLVSPTGANPDNLNSAYYQAFSLENRYINFAVDLGRYGDGAQRFAQSYGGLSLFDATKQAYATIFGGVPSDDKVHQLLDASVGTNLTRADYFADFGQDGSAGLGTKAAMVGWLLAEAEKADVGLYARSNDAYLADVALHGGAFGVDLIGRYAQSGWIVSG